MTDKDVALEIDAYVDWAVNSTFSISFLGAFADPGKAVQQSPAVPRTSSTG